MKNEIILNFLSSYFNVHEAKIEKYTILDNSISGRVFWEVDEEGYPHLDPDEEKQDFLWENSYSEDDLIKMTGLCDFLVTENLISIDKLTISEDELIQLLIEKAWRKKDVLHNIKLLFYEVEVSMVEDGKVSDAFFLHF